MMNQIESKFKRVLRVDIILKILLQGKIPDDGNQFQVVIVLIDIDVVIIITVYKRSVGKKSAVKNVIPSESACRITPLNPEDVGERENIPPEISRQINPVVIVELI